MYRNPVFQASAAANKPVIKVRLDEQSYVADDNDGYLEAQPQPSQSITQDPFQVMMPAYESVIDEPCHTPDTATHKDWERIMLWITCLIAILLAITAIGISASTANSSESQKCESAKCESDIRVTYLEELTANLSASK